MALCCAWHAQDMYSKYTAAVEVFNGTADYQIYMVLPFRLPSYRPGYYLATASFLLLNQVPPPPSCARPAAAALLSRAILSLSTR
eukprot:SAG22_NODE_227_length_14641_cov_11.007908_6_plen_85_part_00